MPLLPPLRSSCVPRSLDLCLGLLLTRDGGGSLAKHCCPVQETAVDGGSKRGRPGKAKRSAQPQQEEQQQGAAAEGPVPEWSWGKAPPRLARVGLAENDAAFGTRLRWADWGLPSCCTQLQLFLNCQPAARIRAVVHCLWQGAGSMLNFECCFLLRAGRL